MPLVDSRGFNLTPDLSGKAANVLNLAGGIQRINQFDKKQQNQEQLRILSGQALSGDVGAKDRLNRQFPEQSLNLDKLQSEKAKAAFDAQSAEKKNEIRNLAQRASFALTLPLEKQLAYLENEVASGLAANKDMSDTQNIIDTYKQNPELGINQLKQTEQFGIKAGVLDSYLGEKSQIKAGMTPSGESAFFNITSEGATQIPGAVPEKRGPLVQVGGANKEQEELAKLRAQNLSSIREKASNAEQQLSSLDIMDNIDIKTGSMEPMKQAIASFSEGFGIDSSGLANVAAGQSFTAEAGKVVLKIMSTQKGPQTDNDRRNIAKTISRLGNRPEANKFINNSARAISNRIIEQRDFFNDFLDKNDSLKGAASAWNKKKKDVPMVSRFSKTPEGLPIFFFRFKERVIEANPDATEKDIISAWKEQERKAKESN